MIVVLDQIEFLFSIRRQMHISVAKYGGAEDLLTIEIASDLTIRDLKVVIESESDFGIKADRMNLYHDGILNIAFFA
jgi:hypothetical protein